MEEPVNREYDVKNPILSIFCSIYYPACYPGVEKRSTQH